MSWFFCGLHAFLSCGGLRIYRVMNMHPARLYTKITPAKINHCIASYEITFRRCQLLRMQLLIRSSTSLAICLAIAVDSFLAFIKGLNAEQGKLKLYLCKYLSANKLCEFVRVYWDCSNTDVVTSVATISDL